MVDAEWNIRKGEWPVNISRVFPSCKTRDHHFPLYSISMGMHQHREGPHLHPATASSYHRARGTKTSSARLYAGFFPP